MCGHMGRSQVFPVSIATGSVLLGVSCQQPRPSITRAATVVRAVDSRLRRGATDMVMHAAAELSGHRALGT
jgi:hypothetical protein